MQERHETTGGQFGRNCVGTVVWGLVPSGTNRYRVMPFESTNTF